MSDYPNTFKKQTIPIYLCLLILPLLCLISLPHPSSAQDSVCAVVKKKIRQELTLEHRAFDAHMRLNNGLTDVSIENVDISVNFADGNGNAVPASSDPNNTEALKVVIRI